MKKDPSVYEIHKKATLINLESSSLHVPIFLLNGIFENKDETFKRIASFCICQYAVDKLHSGGILQRVMTAGQIIGFDVNEENVNHVYRKGMSLYYEFTSNDSRRGEIGMTTFLDFANTEKTEFELASFCALVALKSYIQGEPYRKCYDWSLPFLMNNISSLNDRSLWVKSRQNRQIDSYLMKPNRDKLINYLTNKWHLAYARDRCKGFFVSFKLSQYELSMLVGNTQ
jgi:hypothetical protein